MVGNKVINRTQNILATYLTNEHATCKHWNSAAAVFDKVFGDSNNIRMDIDLKPQLLAYILRKMLRYN